MTRMFMILRKLVVLRFLADRNEQIALLKKRWLRMVGQSQKARG